MGSFGGLRNWLFLAVFGLLITVGGVMEQDNRARVSSLEIRMMELRTAHDKDLNELRERWNTEYQGIISNQGQSGERLGKVETELRVEHEEIISRLDRIEAKLH